MGLFSKKIRVDKEGRELEIIDDTKDIDHGWLKNVINEIEKFYLSEPKFKNLNYFKIRFTSKISAVEELGLPLIIKQVYESKGFNAQVLKDGTVDISLGLPYNMWLYEKRKKGKDVFDTIVDFLQRTIFHEFCHLWHHNVSRDIKIARRKHLSLFKKDKALNEKLEKEFREDAMIGVANIRHILFILLIKLFEEGLVTFMELERDNKIKFDKKNYEKHYASAEKLANELKNGFDFTLEVCKDNIQKSLIFVNSFFQHVNNCSYGIGFHMIYSILYFNKKESIARIILLSPFNFIRLYEKTMLKNRQKPVLTIGKEGNFSYNWARDKHEQFMKSFR